LRFGVLLPANGHWRDGKFYPDFTFAYECHEFTQIIPDYALAYELHELTPIKIIKCT